MSGGFVIGGDTAWKVRAFRDLGLAYHWVNGEPAVVVYPLHRHLRQNKAVPYALPLESLHELVDKGTKGTGVNTGVLLQKARTAAMVMGIGEDWATVKNVADAILDSIVDLVNMPPEPAWLEQRRRPPEVGEVAVKVDGQTVWEGKA